MPSSELSDMYYVYLLIVTKTGEKYIGYTNNLVKRIAQHNTGQNRSTKHNDNWKLIYFEAHRNKYDAMRREKYLKTSQGKQALSRMCRQELINMSESNSRKVYY